MNHDLVLERLIELSHALARPERDLVILAEGNTSARIEDETFLVKASGAQLAHATADSFVELRLVSVLELLDRPGLDDAGVKQAISGACVRPTPAPPSIETFLHALALTQGRARWVGHTHPSAVNAILCSVHPTALSDGQLFPDALVVYGAHPLFVPYHDPGLPLAAALREAISRHQDNFQEPVKLILLQNHGLIALGQSPEEVESITSMAVKAARVVLGTYALGGPHYMEPEHVARIMTRPDELFRRQQLQ